jgi:hypothetical protein
MKHLQADLSTYANRQQLPFQARPQKLAEISNKLMNMPAIKTTFSASIAWYYDLNGKVYSEFIHPKSWQYSDQKAYYLNWYYNTDHNRLPYKSRHFSSELDAYLDMYSKYPSTRKPSTILTRCMTDYPEYFV